MPKVWRDLLIAISLSNLCFLWAWETLANPAYYSFYFIKGSGSITEPIALVLDVLILAALFGGLVQLARRSKYRLPLIMARWIFLLLLAVPVYTILHKREAQSVRGEFDLPGWALIATAACGILLLMVAYRWRRHAMKVAVTCVLILSPLIVVNFGNSAWLLHKHGQTLRNANYIKPSQAPSNSGQKHIVWIVFDELDQRVTFGQRPAGLSLPELDRLRGESFYAPKAYPPAGYTLHSMPALITGRSVATSTPLSPNELALTFEDQKVANWSTVKNVFSDARESGFSAAVAGWYHPYCRVIGASLDFCTWYPLAERPQNQGSAFSVLIQNMVFWVRHSFYRIPLNVVRRARNSHQIIQHHSAYRGISTDGFNLATDLNWNLVMIHFPIPHAPFMYDSKARQFSRLGDRTYYDNLAFVDDTLGQIRRAMESAQVWEKSTVLITSDHAWRERPNGTVEPDHRVPFILKLPGRPQPMVYERPFRTLVTRDLLINILRGDLMQVEEVKAWLDQQPEVSVDPRVILP